MATFKGEFQDLAVELISDEFADFRVPFRVFKQSAEYDPRDYMSDKLVLITNELLINPNEPKPPTGESYDLEAIPLELQDADRVFSNATSDSIYLVALKAGSTVKLDSSYQCELDGVNLAIEIVDNDSADAVWFFRLAR